MSRYGVPMNAIVRLKPQNKKSKFQCRLCGKEHTNENFGFCSKSCRKAHPSFLVSYEFTDISLAKEFVVKRRKEHLIFIVGDNHKTWLVTKGNSLKLKEIGYKEIT